MNFEPKLDARLEAVLGFIRADTHADLGTDHAGLPIRLVQTGRVRRCIGIDLNAAPLALARRQVQRAGVQQAVELRQGDGLEPLSAGEVQSLSMTGLGGATIAAVLERGRSAGRLPPRLVVQPNDTPEALRLWAQHSGYWLTAEALTQGRAPRYCLYPVLAFEQAAYGPDPAYHGLPPAAATFGPWLLREAHPLLQSRLARERQRLTPLAARSAAAQLELQKVEEALAWLR